MAVRDYLFGMQMIRMATSGHERPNYSEPSYYAMRPARGGSNNPHSPDTGYRGLRDLARTAGNKSFRDGTWLSAAGLSPGLGKPGPSLHMAQYLPS